MHTLTDHSDRLIDDLVSGAPMATDSRQLSFLLAQHDSTFTSPHDLNLSVPGDSEDGSFNPPAPTPYGGSFYRAVLPATLIAAPWAKVRPIAKEAKVAFLTISAAGIMITGVHNGFNLTSEVAYVNLNLPLEPLSFGVSPGLVSGLATGNGAWDLEIDLGNKRLTAHRGASIRSGRISRGPDDLKLVRFEDPEVLTTGFSNELAQRALRFLKPLIPKKSNQQLDRIMVRGGSFVARSSDAIAATAASSLKGADFDVLEPAIPRLMAALSDKVLPATTEFLSTTTAFVLGGGGTFAAWQKPERPVNEKWLSVPTGEPMLVVGVEREQLLTTQRIFACGGSARAPVPMAVTIAADGEGISISLAADHGNGCVCEHTHAATLESGAIGRDPVHLIVDGERLGHILEVIESTTATIELLTDRGAFALRFRAGDNVLVLFGSSPKDRLASSSRYRSRRA